MGSKWRLQGDEVENYGDTRYEVIFALPMAEFPLVSFHRLPVALANEILRRYKLARINFHLRIHVNFMRVNKIEAMYGNSRVNVKVDLRSTFTFTRSVSYIASILFKRVLFTRVNTCKLRVSGNPP